LVFCQIIEIYQKNNFHTYQGVSTATKKKYQTSFLEGRSLLSDLVPEVTESTCLGTVLEMRRVTSGINADLSPKRK